MLPHLTMCLRSVPCAVCTLVIGYKSTRARELVNCQPFDFKKKRLLQVLDENIKTSFSSFSSLNHYIHDVHQNFNYFIRPNILSLLYIHLEIST